MLFPMIPAQAEVGGELYDVGGILLFAATLLIIAAIGMCLFALADATGNRELRGNRRWIWGVVIIAVPLIGPILYWTIGRKRSGAEV